MIGIERRVGSHGLEQMGCAWRPLLFISSRAWWYPGGASVSVVFLLQFRSGSCALRRCLPRELLALCIEFTEWNPPLSTTVVSTDFASALVSWDWLSSPLLIHYSAKGLECCGTILASSLWLALHYNTVVGVLSDTRNTYINPFK